MTPELVHINYLMDRRAGIDRNYSITPQDTADYLGRVQSAREGETALEAGAITLH